MKGFLKSFFLLLYLSSLWAQNPSQSAIATSHPLATQAGMQILAEGGNAFDAAITIAGVLSVVEPYNSGLGGGGFWLLHEANGKNIVIDARERSPIAAIENRYMKNKKVDPNLTKEGALSAAIPGIPAAMSYISNHYGKLPLTKTLSPAILLARQGFPVDADLAKILESKKNLLKRFPATKALFFKNNKLLRKGDILKQPLLAQTLNLLATSGYAGFYQGKNAEKMVKEVRKAGGLWQLKDLEQYQVNLVEPLVHQYRDLNIITTPLPSLGGIFLIGALNILAEYELQGLSEADHKHLIVETMRRVYCNKELLGDPKFNQINVDRLLSESYAEKLRSTIEMNRASENQGFKCSIFNEESENTTHFSILDEWGNLVAATLTINHHFGSGMIIPGTGILLNDEMDDFDIHQSKSLNKIAPMKKPLSNMTPTFIEMPSGIGILGATGGMRIPAILLLGVLAAEKDVSPQTWVLTPRYYPFFDLDVIYFEPNAFSVPLQHALAIRGHKLQALKETFGNMQAIYWDKENNQVYAASDPREHGLALVKTVSRDSFLKKE